MSLLDKSEKKWSAKEALRAAKGSTLFLFNEDVDGTIKIVKSLENASLLIDGETEIFKHEIKKKKKVDFFELC